MVQVEFLGAWGECRGGGEGGGRWRGERLGGRRRRGEGGGGGRVSRRGRWIAVRGEKRVEEEGRGVEDKVALCRRPGRRHRSGPT